MFTAPKRPQLAMLFAIPLVLVLFAGCSDDDPDVGAVPADGSTAASSVADPALTAIATAEAAVSGGQAIAYDRGEAGDRPEVEIAAGGVSYDVELTSDGTGVARQEMGEPLDAEDSARLSAAQVSLSDAISAASQQVPDGVVDGAELDGLPDQAYWDIELLADGTLRAVRVDAATGSVLG